MGKKIQKEELISLYEKLFALFGPQHWWPGETPWEVAVGAILTQNTNWSNVERAIKNLKQENFLEPEKIKNCEPAKLAELIRPAGYFNIKAERLKNLACWWLKNVVDDKPKYLPAGINFLRNSLLSVKGVGEETADSILLYSFNLPVFVIDAYTRRLMNRHFNVPLNTSYSDLQDIFMKSLPSDPALFNEFHALIVRIGKEYCKKSQCRTDCPLNSSKKKHNKRIKNLDTPMEHFYGTLRKKH